MRILSLGVGLPGAPVDNHTFANAPTLFDYDAVVVDPHALSVLIGEIVGGGAEHQTSAGERVVNGATGTDTVGLADLLRSRRDEAQRLLDRGGLAACFAYPNAVHQGVAGFSGCDRYCWLPAPEGLHYGEPLLRRGSGSEIIVLEHDHAFGPFMESMRTKLAYHAYFDETAPGFAGAANVIARSAGGAPVAVQLTVGRGSVVFLPPLARPPTGEARYAFSNALQDAIRHALNAAARSAAPAWVAEYGLPGLSERIADRDAAKAAAEQATAGLLEQEERVQELDAYRSLLWQEGAYGLERPVRQALALIGFRVAPPDAGAPAQLHLEAQGTGRPVTLLEVEAGIAAAGMAGHYRLRRRLEEAIAAGHPKRGLLVINGHRTVAPAERPPQYDDALRIAAESLRYCIATTEQLYHAVRANLDGDEATVAAFRERLLTTEGVLQED